MGGIHDGVAGRHAPASFPLTTQQTRSFLSDPRRDPGLPSPQRGIIACAVLVPLSPSPSVNPPNPPPLDATTCDCSRESFHAARLPKEPIVGGVRHALGPNTSNGASLRRAPGRDHAIHGRHPLRATRAVVIQLQPLHGPRARDPLVGRRRGIQARNLADSRLEPDGAEVKDGDAAAVEEVVAEELEGRQPLRRVEVGRRGEGAGGVGAILGPRELVERDGRLPEERGGCAVPEGLAEAGLLGARVEEGGIVEYCEGTGG